MASHFHPIKIKSTRQETADCISIVFDIPENLKENFSYKQGQHLTLRTYINGEELRRNYSLCGSPLQDEWRIAIKKMEGGLFSIYANEKLKAGDTIDVLPPMGNFFTSVDPMHAQQYVAIAAGSGITPILSIIKTTLLIEPGSKFTLVYGNRDRSSIIFREDIEALKNKSIDRFCVYYIFSREKAEIPINQGRIDQEKCGIIFDRLINPHTIDEFFICGPAGMIQTVREYLDGKGIDKTKIHFELFTSSTQKLQGPSPVILNANEDEKKSTITIKLDGTESSFELAHGGESILNAALRRGADLPYACKSGVCCTCKAKLEEGQVDMDINYGLEAEEIAAGYILTCQSHPVSERVVVDFD